MSDFRRSDGSIRPAFRSRCLRSPLDRDARARRVGELGLVLGARRHSGVEVERTQLAHVEAAVPAAVPRQVAVDVRLVDGDQRSGGVDDGDLVTNGGEDEEVVVARPADDQVARYPMPRIAARRHDEIVERRRHVEFAAPLCRRPHVVRKVRVTGAGGPANVRSTTDHHCSVQLTL